MLRSMIIFFSILFFCTVSNTYADIAYQMAITSKPYTFDPCIAKDTDSVTILVQLFDRLFMRTPEGEILPELIEKYQISKDRKKYQFTLKDNIFFHDGKAIESYDVLYTLKKSIKTKQYYLKGLKLIDGASSFYKQSTTDLAGFRIIDSKNFEIDLLHPFPVFIELLTDVNLSIISRDFEQNLKRNLIIGSGPYKLDSVKDDKVILSRFDKYWDHNITIDKIIYRVVNNEKAALELLKNNLIDNTHPFKLLNSFVDNTWTHYNFFHSSVRFIGFNISNHLLRDENVRKALISILPVEELHKKFNQNHTIPIGFFLPYGLPGYIAENWRPYMDKASALQTLKDVTWNGHVTLTTYLPDDDINQISESICNVWLSNNIPCKLKKVSLNEFIKLSKENRTEVFIAKLMPNVPTARELLFFFKSDSSFNIFGVKDAEIDKLFDESLYYSSLHDRVGAYQDINRLIEKQSYAIPLQYMGQQNFYIKKKFIIPPIGINGPYFLRVNAIGVNNE